MNDFHTWLYQQNNNLEPAELAERAWDESHDRVLGNWGSLPCAPSYTCGVQNLEDRITDLTNRLKESIMREAQLTATIKWFLSNFNVQQIPNSTLLPLVSLVTFPGGEVAYLETLAARNYAVSQSLAQYILLEQQGAFSTFNTY